jgi:hypothetical protein
MRTTFEYMYGEDAPLDQRLGRGGLARERQAFAQPERLSVTSRPVRHVTARPSRHGPSVHTLHTHADIAHRAHRLTLCADDQETHY